VDLDEDALTRDGSVTFLDFMALRRNAVPLTSVATCDLFTQQVATQVLLGLCISMVCHVDAPRGMDSEDGVTAGVGPTGL